MLPGDSVDRRYEVGWLRSGRAAGAAPCAGAGAEGVEDHNVHVIVGREDRAVDEGGVYPRAVRRAKICNCDC